MLGSLRLSLSVDDGYVRYVLLGGYHLVWNVRVIHEKGMAQEK